jgi:ABC-type bacteriocin/lantibiotic exporter with double-glycine peptidase domain
MIRETQSYSPTKRFWQLLKPDAREIRNVYIYSIFNGLVNLSLPLGIQAIINLIQGGQVSTAWIVLVVFVVAGIAVSGLISIFQLRITEHLQQKIFTRAAFEFAYRIPRIRMESLYKHFAPELMNRFFDVMTVQKGLSKILITISAAGLQVIFGLVLLSLYHPFFLIFSLALVVLVYAILRLSVRKGLETSLVESKHKYKVAHWLEEVARTGNSFKLAGKTDLPLLRADGHIEDYVNARENHFKVLVQQYSLMVLFKVIVATGLLAIGGILVMEQIMNIGQFVAAEIIILLVINSVEKLILSLETIYDVLTSLEKIGQVTDMELESNQGVDLELECPLGGLTVELSEVTFSYPESSRPVLNSLNLRVECGERLLVSGANGSGKSTFLHVVAGIYELQEGHISYNGFPRNNLQLDSLRSVVGGCLVEEQLFEGTLLENITMGREKATFENVKWAIQKLGLESFVRTLPKGYDTVLDPLGKKLSRSTIQKLLIARSIADKPKLLLLEYAFEHIDRQERMKIIDFLTNPDNKWTIIAITNDDYLAQKSDRIAFMRNGAIDKIGPYSEMKSLINFKKSEDA